MDDPPTRNDQASPLDHGTTSAASLPSASSTEQIRALEAEIAQRQGLLDTIFEASSDGLAILSAEGVFLEINPAYERLTGMKRSEWVGRRVTDDSLGSPNAPRRCKSYKRRRRRRR
jgi:PAS domain-containing protein